MPVVRRITVAPLTGDVFARSLISLLLKEVSDGRQRLHDVNKNPADASRPVHHSRTADWRRARPHEPFTAVVTELERP